MSNLFALIVVAMFIEAAISYAQTVYEKGLIDREKIQEIEAFMAELETLVTIWKDKLMGENELTQDNEVTLINWNSDEVDDSIMLARNVLFPSLMLIVL